MLYVEIAPLDVLSQVSRMIGCNRAVILMSIKPKYGDQILDGVKKYELRRVIARPVRRGDLVILYFSRPVKSIMGYFIAGNVIVDRPERLRIALMSLRGTGIDEEDWMYVSGSRRAMAIEVMRPTRTRPLSLQDLRALGISPPISYRWLSTDVAAILMKKLNIEVDALQHEHAYG